MGLIERSVNIPGSHATSLAREFRGVQVLRGLAACMVVVYHATQTWSQHVGATGGTWSNGASGVDIFFVISGFVMTVSTRQKRDLPHPARDFMERRLVRIVPMYWLITALTLLKLYGVHLRPDMKNLGPHAVMSAGYIVSSFLFVPFRNSLGVIQPVLMVGWTLSFEMLFYLFFACALALRLSEVRLLAPVMIVLAVAGTWVGNINPIIGVNPAIGTLASPLLLEFLAGVVIARAIETGWRMRPAFAAVVGSISLCAIMVLPQDFLFGIAWLGRETFATLLILSAVALEPHITRHVPKWALLIGDASYSLYLIHLFLFAFLFKVVNRLGLLAPGATHWTGEVASVLLFVIPAVLISVAIYRWVEAPLNNTLRRKLKLRNAKMQPTPS